MIAELDRRARVRFDQVPERCPSLDERSSPQILAFKVEKIESKEHDPVRRLVDGRAQGVEIGETVLVLNHDFAIDQGGVTSYAAFLNQGDRPCAAPP